MNTHTCHICGKQILEHCIAEYYLDGSKRYECFECNTAEIFRLEQEQEEADLNT